MLTPDWINIQDQSARQPLPKKNRNKNINLDIYEYRNVCQKRCSVYLVFTQALKNPATQRKTCCAWKYICLLIYRFPQTLNTCNAAQTQHDPFWLAQRKRETTGFCSSCSSWWSASDQRQGWPAGQGAMPNGLPCPMLTVKSHKIPCSSGHHHHQTYKNIYVVSSIFTAQQK